MLNSRKETEKPYLVFNTEEEFQKAVALELQKMQDQDDTKSVKNKLLAEEAELKKEVPEFDLKTMLKEDPEFRERILKGYSVEEAFYLSNRKKNAEPRPKKKIGMRENGRASFSGAGVERNVNNMSDEEFKKYINSIKGSKI